MVDFQTLSIVLTGIGLIIALTYYSLQIRNQNITRQAQLFMQMLSQFNQPSMVESRDFYYDVELNNYEEYLQLWDDPEKRKQHRLFGGFVEGLGVLVREGFLDVKVVAGLIGGTVKALWEKQAPFVIEYREHMNVPRAWIEWEYLYNELMRYAERHPELGIQDTEYKEKSG